MTIESILERAAVALERLAAATEENTRLNDKWTSYLLAQKTAAEVPTVSSETAEVKPEATASSEWDPYTAPVQGKYGKDKREILEAEAKKHGVEFADKTTGAQLHEALLNACKNDDAPAERPAPVVEDKPFTPVVEDDFDIETPTATKDEAKAALKNYAVQNGREAAVNLIKEVSGCDKLGEVEELDNAGELFAIMVAKAKG